MFELEQFCLLTPIWWVKSQLLSYQKVSDKSKKDCDIVIVSQRKSDLMTKNNGSSKRKKNGGW